MHTVLEFLAQNTVLLIFLLLGVGTAVGMIRVKGVSLGPAAVLFCAIGLTALGTTQGVTIELPALVGDLGLVLFTYTVGIMSGPGFFASFRHGLGPIGMTVVVLGLGAAIAFGVGTLFGLDAPTISGTFAGAVTNTPALAAASEAAGDAAAPTVGYSVSYLFGVIGMLAATMLALRQGKRDQDAPKPLVNLTIRVERSDNPLVKDIEGAYQGKLTFSRVRHGETNPILVAEDEDELRHDDLVTVVGPGDLVNKVAKELGHPSSHRLNNDRRYLDFRRITLSNGKLAGRSIAELDLAGRFGATVSRVRRADVDMVASDDLVLQPGDRLRVIAPTSQMKKISAFLGDSARGLSDINPLALGFGMCLGILIGAIHIPLPGGGFAIGSAAGTLIVGLVLGRLGRIGPMITTMPHLAATALSEFGLLAFLAFAGTKAGLLIVGAISSGEAAKILVVGIVVTSFVAIGVYLVMRNLFKMGGTKLSGVLGGTQTQPAVLAFANERTGYDNRVALGYALVYPAAMIAKVLLAQILGTF